ncbi:MAG: TIGR04282 family arsenosugar biosynthesis glycosyltransferase [Bradyrhizobium sp.]|nr:TIGR04282 family arsenosugar biosynthesis glycosyltransferase [Bradyrhizobium sp.]
MCCTRHLVIFTRLSRLGQGKRRLARDIGAVEALRFQRVMLASLLRRLARDPRWTTWLGITPDRSGPWPRGIATLPQGGGDLGHRMARIARNLPLGPVVIIGSDIPNIAASDIVAAFRFLGAKDAVFGPAMDGGYWLVGLRRRPRFINPFANVRWSSEHALADTLANLTNKEVAMLRTLRDIDDAEAWRRNRRREVTDAHSDR